MWLMITIVNAERGYFRIRAFRMSVGEGISSPKVKPQCYVGATPVVGEAELGDYRTRAFRNSTGEGAPSPRTELLYSI